MGVVKSIYVCKECGAKYSKWLGRCQQCGGWSTLEEVAERTSSGGRRGGVERIVFREASLQDRLVSVEESEDVAQERFCTGLKEFDRVLGEGFVSGSVVLLGGDPGVGKSTLLLQATVLFCGKRTLYVSGEENIGQIRQRVGRLVEPFLRGEDGVAEGFDRRCYEETNWFLNTTCLEEVFVAAEDVKPELLVIDSIQTICTEEVESSIGSVTQIKECAARLIRLAKSQNITVVLVGHITKDGVIAGPKILEHLVDVVLQFEGDDRRYYRVLRCHKNRFGSTDEIGLFEMFGSGLREVSNPALMLMSGVTTEISGRSIGAIMDGNRVMMCEIQSLVSGSAYGTPQRVSTGFDTKRMSMLLAVIEKRIGMKVSQKDVFLNIAGGIRINDTAIDLSVVMAVLSSNMDLVIDSSTLFIAEVGLGGELRIPQRLVSRVREADRLGYNRVFIPMCEDSEVEGLRINVVKRASVAEVFRDIFGF